MDLRRTRNIQDHHLTALAAAQAGVPSLSVLKLAGNRAVTDASMTKLISAVGRTLTVLWIEDCPGISDETLKAVGECAKVLGELHLSTLKRITDFGIGFLSSVESLVTFKMHACNMVSDVSTKMLFAALQNLETVELYRINDPAILALNKTKLRHLCLGEMSSLSDESLIKLYSSPMRASFPLSSLTICHSEDITNESLKFIFTSCPNLESLDISLVGHISSASLESAANLCPNLQHLVVSGNLVPTPDASRPEDFNLPGSSFMRDDSQLNVLPAPRLVNIVERMRRLTTLTVFQSWDLEDVHVNEMARFESMRRIYLKNCRLIREIGVERSVERCRIFINTLF
ncbi:hypothetical protein HDU67_005059 [Dinochytrium kinnereticum]|nr:hypothetical protein HDU67_005059 [Dinochytrium kinnereticum]